LNHHNGSMGLEMRLNHELAELRLGTSCCRCCVLRDKPTTLDYVTNVANYPFKARSEPLIEWEAIVVFAPTMGSGGGSSQRVLERRGGELNNEPSRVPYLTLALSAPPLSQA